MQPLVLVCAFPNIYSNFFPPWLNRMVRTLSRPVPNLWDELTVTDDDTIVLKPSMTMRYKTEQAGRVIEHTILDNTLS